eukprot:jgi/Bigna1/85953/estExt_fgenesh1_pg.C_70094
MAHRCHLLLRRIAGTYRLKLSMYPRWRRFSGSNTLPQQLMELKQKCDQGDADAGYELARSFKLGTKGVKRDFKAAAEYFLISSNMGHVKAMTELGSMSLVGYGMEKNADLAYSWLKKAAEQDEPEAQVKMAEVHKSINVYLSHPIRLCRPNRFMIWRKMHRRGLGEGGLSYDRALALYSRAAKTGHPRGEYGLGDMLLRGQGTEQNVGRGYELMVSAAKKGLADAQFNLGVLYANKAVPVTVMNEPQIERKENVARAEFWLLKAGEQGHRDAMGRLTELYNRKLTPVLSHHEQEERAMYWARQGAETGLASAQRDLGFMLLVGRPDIGVEVDLPKAMTWLFYASQQNYTDAAFAVGHLMASAPTADIHSKQLREMFEQATVEPTPGPGLGFTLCQVYRSEETIPDPAAFNSSRVRALLLQDPHNSERWLQQFQQAEGRAWEGGIDGGLNGLFGCSKVSI